MHMRVNQSRYGDLTGSIDGFIGTPVERLFVHTGDHGTYHTDICGSCFTGDGVEHIAIDRIPSDQQSGLGVSVETMAQREDQPGLPPQDNLSCKAYPLSEMSVYPVHRNATVTKFTPNTAGFSSPPCFAHEIQPGQNGYEVIDPQTAVDVARWRKAERQRLIALRLEVPARERQQAAVQVADKLDEILKNPRDTIVSVYWPFSGELNLRDWMQKTVEKGFRVALPVVETKSHPLVFREWTPQSRMEPGIWNIPVPVDGQPVEPTHIVSPLVGFDSAGYRLGYGGGYFDRTLAQLHDKGLQPVVIGVGHSLARIATIYPQPHDIPMNIIVTESGDD